MAVSEFSDLMNHVGHDIEVETYGREDQVLNVAITCMTCHEILLDYNHPEEKEPVAYSLRSVFVDRKTIVEQVGIPDSKSDIELNKSALDGISVAIDEDD